MSKALVIIDVQKGMWSPGFAPYDGDGVVARIADLIAKARTAGVPIMYVQHHGEDEPNHPLKPGLPGYPFHDAIAPQTGDDVTVKSRSSAFHGTDFDTKLRRAGIDHLVITGMQSEFCVDSAVRGACERGYKVTLVSDAHSTGDTRVARAKDIIAIQNDTLGGGFAYVRPAADIVF
jgi:nicotinamidase-related amidase